MFFNDVINVLYSIYQILLQQNHSAVFICSFIIMLCYSSPNLFKHLFLLNCISNILNTIILSKIELTYRKLLTNGGGVRVLLPTGKAIGR